MKGKNNDPDPNALADADVYISERNLLLQRKFQISSDQDRALITFPFAVLAFAAPNLLGRIKSDWAWIFAVGCLCFLSTGLCTLKSMQVSLMSYDWSIKKLDDDRSASFPGHVRSITADEEDPYHGKAERWTRFGMYLLLFGFLCLVVSLIESQGVK